MPGVPAAPPQPIMTLSGTSVLVSFGKGSDGGSAITAYVVEFLTAADVVYTVAGCNDETDATLVAS